MTVSLEVRWDEGPISVSSGGATGEIRYVARSDDPANDGRDEVINALTADSPDTLYGLVRDDFRVSTRLSDSDAEAHWDCVVSYTLASSKQPYPLFSTPGAVRPVRLSINSAGSSTFNMIRSKAFNGQSVQDNKNIYTFVGDNTELIGIEANQEKESTTMYEVKGVPVSLYHVEAKVETIALDSEVDNGYLVDLAGYAGRNVINSASWKGFNTWVMKFTGFTATQRADKTNQAPSANQELWDLQLNFALAPYEPINFPDNWGGNDLPGPPVNTKRGHELLDVLYVEQKEAQDLTWISIPTPVRFALHRIYDEVNFDTDLGLGNIL